MNKNKKKNEEGLPTSIRQRLLTHAQKLNLDYNLVLERYGLERYLYRLSKSPHGDRFVLKGALMILVWLGETIRPTRDADLLGFGELDKEELLTIFQEVCGAEIEPDGMEYFPDSVTVDDIRENDPYGGRRIRFRGTLGNAKLSFQMDVGIGDAVTPDPVWLDYPSLLEFPKPRLRAYQPETSIAEKLQAMVVLGLPNTRMKDYFDIAALAEHEHFDGPKLASAIKATFERRGTAFPETTPIGLTKEFAADKAKQQQWTSFIKTSRLASAPTLETAVTSAHRLLVPILEALTRAEAFKKAWKPGGPWK